MRLEALSYQSDIQNAQRVYKDILNGYSFFTYRSEKIYVKHLSDLDHGNIQEYRKKCFDEAKSRGVQTEKEQIDSAINQKVWTRKDENRIVGLKHEISQLNETKSKLKLKSQKKNVDVSIKKYTKELDDLEEKRLDLIGITCENYSDKKTNERYLFYTCFKDKELQERLFSEEEFEYLEPHELSELVIENNKVLTELDSQSVKGIAACPFFLNNLMLSKDSPIVFFGKPIVELTNYQTELFSTGMRWKRVLETAKSSPPFVQSLSEMVKWYEQEIAAESTEGETKDIHSGARGVASSIVGADKEELDKMAGEVNLPGVSLSEEAEKIKKETGRKVLNMWDMMKIQGEL